MGTANEKTSFPPTRPVALAVLAALVVAAATLAADTGAQSIDGLNARITGAREEASALAAEIEATSAELAAVQSEAIAAAQREAELSAVLAVGEEREARLEAALAAAREQLAETRARLGDARAALAARLVAIYRSGMPDVTTILLDSEGMDDLITRAEYLERIEEADAALVARVRALRDQVEGRVAAVDEAEAATEAHNAELAAARDQIAAARAAAEARAAALADARAARASAIEQLQSKIGGWQEEVQRLERISARQAAQEVSDWFGDWAIPESIVMCESGGNWDAVNPGSGAGGAYQILPSTWELYGGEGDPEDASPAEQSEIASQIWTDSGSGAWVCAG